MRRSRRGRSAAGASLECVFGRTRGDALAVDTQSLEEATGATLSASRAHCTAGGARGVRRGGRAGAAIQARHDRERAAGRPDAQSGCRQSGWCGRRHSKRRGDTTARQSRRCTVGERAVGPSSSGTARSTRAAAAVKAAQVRAARRRSATNAANPSSRAFSSGARSSEDGCTVR